MKRGEKITRKMPDDPDTLVEYNPERKTFTVFTFDGGRSHEVTVSEAHAREIAAFIDQMRSRCFIKHDGSHTCGTDHAGWCDGWGCHVGMSLLHEGPGADDHDCCSVVAGNPDTPECDTGEHAPKPSP